MKKQILSALAVALSTLSLTSGAWADPTPTPTPAPPVNSTSPAPAMRGMVFGTNVQVPSAYRTYSTSVKDKKVEAFTELRWADPPVPGPEGILSEQGWRAQRLLDGLASTLGLQFGEQTHMDAPLPFFAGTATIGVEARKWTPNGDGQALFDPQQYHWVPSVSSDPLANPVPGSDLMYFWSYGYTSQNFEDLILQPSLAEPQRTMAWTFAALKAPPEGADPDNPVYQPVQFPISKTVEVDVTSDDGVARNLKGKVEIQWYPSWMPESTGMQNTVTLQPGDMVRMANGDTKFATALVEGDSIMCWTRGEVGSLYVNTDNTIGARPDIVGSTVQPQPNEKHEARVVLVIYPHDDGSVTIVLDAMPHIDPENDPDAPGYDEIQQTRIIDATYQQTLETGKAALITTLQTGVAAAEQVSIGRLQGWGIEAALNCVIKGAQLLEEAAAAGRAAQRYEETAASLSLGASNLRSLIARGVVSGEKAAQYEKKAADYDRAVVQCQQAARDAQGVQQKYTALGNRLKAEAQLTGCFVSGTPVAMADGRTKPIERIQVGEEVLAKDIVSGAVEPKQVVRTTSKRKVTPFRLTFSDSQSIETTGEHPIYVEGQGFVKARDLHPGDKVCTRRGKSLEVSAVNYADYETTVFNLTVRDFHTYFVGEDAGGVLVHNVDCVKSNMFLGDVVKDEKGKTHQGILMYQFFDDGSVTYAVGIPKGAKVRGNELFKNMVDDLGGIQNIKSFNNSYIDDNLANINAGMDAGEGINEALKHTTTWKWMELHYPNVPKHFESIETIPVTGPGPFTKVHAVLKLGD